MKKIYIITFLALSCSIFSQKNEKVVSVNYGKTEIELSPTTKILENNEISTSTFYAKWIYIKKEPNGNGPKMINAISPFENEVKGNELGKIIFISNGNQFSGIKYKCSSCSKFKFKILAFGEMNNEIVILNLWFTKEPKSNTDLDSLMKKFIILK